MAKPDRSILMINGRIALILGIAIALQGLVRLPLGAADADRDFFLGGAILAAIGGLIAIAGGGLVFMARSMPNPWDAVPREQLFEITVAYNADDIRRLQGPGLRKAAIISIVLLALMAVGLLAFGLAIGEPRILFPALGLMLLVVVLGMVFWFAMRSRRPFGAKPLMEAHTVAFGRPGYRRQTRSRRHNFEASWRAFHHLEETSDSFTVRARWYASGYSLVVPKRAFASLASQEEFRRQVERRWEPLPEGGPSWKPFTGSGRSRRP